MARDQAGTSRLAGRPPLLLKRCPLPLDQSSMDVDIDQPAKAHLR